MLRQKKSCRKKRKRKKVEEEYRKAVPYFTLPLHPTACPVLTPSTTLSLLFFFI
jgi:hypothetical protein